MSASRYRPGVTDVALRALVSRPAPQQAAPGAATPDVIDTSCSPETRQLLAAWKTWRGRNLLPRRRDMDLVSICRLMPALTLLEVFSPERAVIRLAGGDIEALFGRRLTGRDYVGLIDDPEQRRFRGAVLWMAVSQPCGLLSFHIYPEEAGGTHQTQACSLPILPDDEDGPVQLLTVTSLLPDPRGKPVKASLLQLGHQRRFIDLGAGLPVIQA